jgi:hypothetical protein
MKGFKRSSYHNGYPSPGHVRKREASKHVDRQDVRIVCLGLTGTLHSNAHGTVIKGCDAKKIKRIHDITQNCPTKEPQLLNKTTCSGRSWLSAMCAKADSAQPTPREAAHPYFVVASVKHNDYTNTRVPLHMTPPYSLNLAQTIINIDTQMDEHRDRRGRRFQPCPSRRSSLTAAWQHAHRSPPCRCGDTCGSTASTCNAAQ